MHRLRERGRSTLVEKEGEGMKKECVEKIPRERKLRFIACMQVRVDACKENSVCVCVCGCERERERERAMKKFQVAKRKKVANFHLAWLATSSPICVPIGQKRLLKKTPEKLNVEK